MTTVSVGALAIVQVSDATAHDIHLLTWFVFIIALALAAASAGMILMAVYAAKLLHSVDGIAKEVKLHTAPLLDKTHALVTELGPKLSSLTTNAEHISTTVKTKVDELAVTVTQLNETVQQVNLKTRVHVVHVDGIVKDALNATEDISKTVQEGIKAPLRQVVGVVAGIRAGVEKLVQLSPFGR